MTSWNRRALVLTAALCAACAPPAPEDLKAAAAVMPVSGGKQDIADRVSMQGDLVFGEASALEFTEDLEFHAWRLTVRPGARMTLEVTNKGTTVAIDTTLFVFGPRTDAGYGATALAFDDDSGWGKNPRLKELSLAAGGDYLVVVGTHDGRGRGRYRLLGTCLDDACLAAPACHPALVGGFAECVDAQMADGLDAGDAADVCRDAEALGPVYDAACTGFTPAPAFCGSDYQRFFETTVPTCAAAFDAVVTQRRCVFGTMVGSMWQRPGLHATGLVEISEAAQADDLLSQQIVLAAQVANPEITTLAQALEYADEGTAIRRGLWDETAGRAFTVVNIYAGDNYFGRIFVAGTTQTAARVYDGDILECGFETGPGARDCADDSDCDGLTCVGRRDGVGRCADTSPRAGEGTACDTDPAHAGCPDGSGLMCTGASYDGSGFCLPAWMWGTYRAEPGLAIPDHDPNGVSDSLLIYGLATVSMDVHLTAWIDHPRPADLRVTLQNPDGTEALVYNGGQSAYGVELDLDLFAFPSDESVNGRWTLTVTDVATGETGTLNTWSLRLSSRWD